MAENLKEFPGDTRSPKYPWHEWLDGGVWKLRQGPKPDGDYDIKTASMRAVASAAAKKKDGKLKSKAGKDPDGTEFLIIQLVKE